MSRRVVLVTCLLAAAALLGRPGADGKVVKKKTKAPPYVPKVKKTVIDTPFPCSDGAQEGDVLQLGLIAWYQTPSNPEWVYYDKREKKKQEILHEIVLGSGHPIQGWHDGLKGHCLLDMVLLIIPPELGYGMEGTADVPQNATLKHKLTIEEIITAEEVKAKRANDEL